MSQILNSVRWLWRRLVPEKLRYSAHWTAQQVSALPGRAVLQIEAGVHVFQKQIDQWLSDWPGPGRLRVVGLFAASHGISRGAELTCRALDYLEVPYLRIDGSSLVQGPGIPISCRAAPWDGSSR